MELFFAVNIDDFSKKSLHSIAKELHKHIDVDASRFEDKEKFHLTLSYVFNVEAPDILISALEYFNFTPFAIQPFGVGYFANKKSGVVWAGVSNGKAELHSLKNSLDSMLLRQGFNVEQREYTPHITLAYTKPGELPIEKDLLKIKTNMPKLHVDEICLYRAPISFEGRGYEKLATFKLTAGEMT